MHTWSNGIEGVVAMKVVTPQQQTLFELSNGGVVTNDWAPFSRTFKTGDVPMGCRIVLSNEAPRGGWEWRAAFDSLSLVSP